jgi:hypothetical protein
MGNRLYHIQVKRQLATASEQRSFSRLRADGTMSALGQKQTSRFEIAMSALPPKADIANRDRDVRFVPKAEVAVIRSVELIVQPDARWVKVKNPKAPVVTREAEAILGAVKPEQN